MMRFALFTVLSGLAACSSSRPNITQQHTTSSGYVIAGPVAGATVKVTDPMTGRELGATSEPTGPDGAFTIDLGALTGDLMLCASGGTYLDEATGATAAMLENTLCAAELAVLPGDIRHPLITPWSTLVIARAGALVRYKGVAFAEAVVSAQAAVKTLLGCALDFDPLTTVPLDVTTTSDGTASVTPQALAGLLLAGQSQQAVLISESLGLSPAGVVTAVSLTTALADDLRADGIFDGHAGAKAVAFAGYSLSAADMTDGPRGLAQGIHEFLLSPRNALAVTVNDAAPLLKCLAKGREPLVSKTGTGLVDTVGPSITFLAPAAHASLSGSSDVLVTADDPAGVRLFWFDANDALAPAAPALGGPHAELRAVALTTSVADGPLHLTVHATDALGNSSTATLDLAVDNKAPTFTWTAPASGATLAGLQRIELAADDPSGLEAFTLTSPAQLADIDASPTGITANWDTTAAPDGTFTFTAAASDTQGHTATSSRTVTLDNFQPGSVSGIVALDGPIVSAVVTVYAFNDAVLGETFGTATTGADGSFSIPLPDTYKGVISIHATTGAIVPHYQDAVTGNTVTISAQDELHTLVVYAPSAAGADLHIAVNALTTLAAAHSLYYVLHGQPLTSALATADRLFGEYLFRPNTFDITTTLSSNVVSDPLDTTFGMIHDRVALFHVGLARLAVVTALAVGSDLKSANALSLLRLLLRDLEDGIFDGKDASGTTIALTTAADLTTNTLRNTLALQIYLWLGAVALPPCPLSAPACSGNGITNASSRRPKHFGQLGGFLDLVSTDVEPLLFGAAPPLPYDLFAPEITVVTPAQNYPLGVGLMAITATASAVSGIKYFSVFTDGVGTAGLTPPSQATTTTYVGSLEGSLLPSGQHFLRFLVIDNHDNTSIQDRVFWVDRTGPTIAAILDTPLVNATIPVRFTVTFSDPQTPITEVVFRNHATGADLRAPLLYPTSPLLVAVPIGTATVPCDTPPLTIDIIAKNAAGLSTPATPGSYSVRCDSTPPTFVGLGASNFYLTSQLNPHWDAANQAIEFFPAKAGPENLATYDWTNASAPPTLAVFSSRLDAPLGQSSASYEALGVPYLALRFDDTGSVASAHNQLIVQYRYFANGATSPTRTWRNLPYDAATDAFLLPLTYDAFSLELHTIPGQAPSINAVDMLVTDEASNASNVGTFYFKFDVTPAPIALTACRLTSILDSHAITNTTTTAAFLNSYQPSIAEGHLIIAPHQSGTRTPYNFVLNLNTPGPSFAIVELGTQRWANTYHYSYGTAGCNTAVSTLFVGTNEPDEPTYCDGDVPGTYSAYPCDQNSGNTAYWTWCHSHTFSLGAPPSHRPESVYADNSYFPFTETSNPICRPSFYSPLNRIESFLVSTDADYFNNLYGVLGTPLVAAPYTYGDVFVHDTTTYWRPFASYYLNQQPLRILLRAPIGGLHTYIGESDFIGDYPWLAQEVPEHPGLFRFPVRTFHGQEWTQCPRFGSRPFETTEYLGAVTFQLDAPWVPPLALETSYGGALLPLPPLPATLRDASCTTPLSQAAYY